MAKYPPDRMHYELPKGGPIMFRLALLSSLTLLIAGLALAQETPTQGRGVEMVQVTPALTDEVLLNPRMGLYLQYPPLTAKPEDWFMKIAGVAYYRMDWSDLNPEEGVYKFDEFFGPRFNFWVAQNHKRVAFRVMCQSMHSAADYVTPKWVFDKGVPGVQHTALRGQTQTDPVFWDERYLEVQCEFIRKLGEYLDGREGLEFVDIGSIGEWGEMHLARWTPQQLAETGFSHTRYVQAYRRIIDAFVKAFPHTQVFLNVGGQGNQTINDYAALRGVHFRQDGLNPAGASYDVGNWLYKPYSRRGVVCNFEFHSGLDAMKAKGWDLQATLDKALEAPLSYLNTNLGNYYTLPEEARQKLTETARRIGYRFVMTKLEHNALIRLDGEHTARLLVSSTWRNDGVAPCYDSYALEWRLEGAKGQAVASELTFPKVPTTQWWPGEEVSESVLLRLPGTTPPGEYQLKVSMVNPESGLRILLGIAGRDEADWYALGAVQGVTAPATSGKMYEEGFEGEVKPWGTCEGIAATVGDTQAHSGQHALLVTGSCQKAWNYTSFRTPVELQPGSRYRLSAWMLVESMEPANYAPYLKLGVNNQEGKWLTNFNSGTYDLRQMGTWQRLEADVEVPLDGASGDVAIERGSQEAPITARLWLDDVALELVEGL